MDFSSFLKISERAALKSQKGFTLLEVLVVVLVVGLIAAIASPGWFSFLEKSRLTAARDQVHLGIREAQSEAQARGTSWQFSLRERNRVVEWATHPKNIPSSTAQWETLGAKSIRIDEETTFASAGGVYYVRFDEDGNPHRLGRVTLSGSRFSANKRCVVISTLIGAARKSKEQPAPDPNYRRRDRFCY